MGIFSLLWALFPFLVTELAIFPSNRALFLLLVTGLAIFPWYGQISL